MIAIRRTTGGFGLSSFWAAAAFAATPLAVVAGGAVATSVGLSIVAAGKPVDAGADQTIVLPANEVTIFGKINGVSARWVTRAGAERSTVQSPNSATTRITFSQPGSYKFELQSFDAKGRRIGNDSVKVFVQKAAVATTGWRERILNADGSINAAEYRLVANNINREDIVDYRLGPKYADFSHAGEAPAPTVHAPDPTGYGLWPFGSLPANNPGEPNKCVRSEELPNGDYEEFLRGFKGAGWLIGGSHAFIPDNPTDPLYKYGIGNISGSDGNLFDTGGLCMRMRARWTSDWWTRNNIAAPAQPEIADLAARRPDLPLVPVAIARGRSNANLIGFAAFKDGTIAPTKVGNSAPGSFFAEGIRLPSGMVPTAMAVTPYNEFLVVSVWDTNAVKGRLAFIALKNHQMANGSQSQTQFSRNHWMLPGAYELESMKLLGFVDLPFAAPTSIDVSNHVVSGNPRGYDDNNDPAVGDLSRQSARDIWRNVNPFYDVPRRWQQSAQAGYVVVASRAEGKVAFVDMGPLYRYLREMYMTTQANFNRTVSESGTDPNKWPFTFAVAPQQQPVIAATIDVDQPTSVSAGIQTSTITGLDRSTWFGEKVGWSPKEAWTGVEPERIYARRRAYVASMDGTVRIFDVVGLNFPNAPGAGTVPSAPIGTFKVGRNPSFGFTNGISTAPDDLFLVSRGDRSITFAYPNGQVQAVLRDSRLVDPVHVAASFNQAGYGGSGPGRSVGAFTLSVSDFNGKQILTYAVEARRGTPHPEQYPFNTPAGPSLFLFGSAAPFPGKPFMIDLEEII